MKIYEFEKNIIGWAFPLPNGSWIVRTEKGMATIRSVLIKATGETRDYPCGYIFDYGKNCRSRKCWGKDIIGRGHKRFIGRDGEFVDLREQAVFSDECVSCKDYYGVCYKKPYIKTEDFTLAALAGIPENGVILVHIPSKRAKAMNFEMPFKNVIASTDASTFLAYNESTVLIFDNPLLD